MPKALDDFIYCSAFLSVVSLDALRDRPNEDGRPFDIHDPEPLADNQIDRKRACATIRGAVDQLPSRQRAVIQGIFFAENTVTRTAAELEVSGAAVVKLRTKALKHLSSTLAPQLPALFA